MKKEGLILGTAAALGIFIMNLISAYGSYGYFSLTNLINTADPLQILSFGAVFAIIFALIRLGLGRTIFKDSMTGSVTGTGKVVSVAVTFLIMYWGFYQTNFSLSGALSGVGVSSNILYIILGIIFLAGMIYLISKMGFGGFLIILGTVVMGITIFTSWIYEKGAAVAIGAVLLLMGLGFWKHSRNAISSNHGLGEGKSKYEVFALGVLILVLGGILGNGIILDVGLGITSIGLIWFFVSRWHHRIINLHPSLLPSFTGVNAIEQAFTYGVKVTGVSTIFVDEGVDTGIIILQEIVKVLSEDSLESLTAKIHDLEHILLPQTVNIVASDKFTITDRKVLINSI